MMEVYCFLFGWKRCCFFCSQKKSPEVENRSSEKRLLRNFAAEYSFGSDVMLVILRMFDQMGAGAGVKQANVSLVW